MWEEEQELPQHREMITAASHFTECDLDGAETVDRYLSCPVCLGLLRQPTSTECLHRFCSECIETSLRVGKKECPSCRFPISTRRALRRDHNFEALMLTLFPNGLPEEEEVPVDLSEYQFKPLRPPSPSEAPLAMNERKRKGAKLRDHNTAEGRGGTAGRGGGGFNAEKKKPRSEKAPPHPPALDEDALENRHRGDNGHRNGPFAESVERRTAWACPQCTLINSALAKKCKVCKALNPKEPLRKRSQGSGAGTSSRSESMCGGELDTQEEETVSGQGSRKPPKETGAKPGRAPKLRGADAPMDSSECRSGRGKKGGKRPANQQAPAAKQQKRQDAVDEERKKRQARLAHRHGGARVEQEITNAVKPEPALDFSEDAPSIEAQLLARQTFSLHIKSADEAGVVILWYATPWSLIVALACSLRLCFYASSAAFLVARRSFPTANPGNCSAWVSLAPAATVYEASARIKYKLITKNKMFGEVRCAGPRCAVAVPLVLCKADAVLRFLGDDRFSWTEVMKLRDGRYAFALHATMDGVQLALAVSTPLAKSRSEVVQQEAEELLAPMIDSNMGGYGEVGGDGDGVGGEESEESEEEGEEEDAPLSQRRGRHRRIVAEEDTIANGVTSHRMMHTLAGDGNGNDGLLSPDAAYNRQQRVMPLKKRAAQHVAGRRTPPLPETDPSSGGEKGSGQGKRRWAARLTDAALCTVAIAVLCALRRRGRLYSESLIGVTASALQRLPALTSTTKPLRALQDTLRVLVRAGFVSRKRERGDERPPTYALSTHGVEQLSSALELGVAIGSMPAIGSSAPAIGTLPQQPVVHPQRVHQQQHPHGAPSPRDDRDDCHSPHRQRDESGALSAAAAFVHDPSLHLPLIVPPPQARRTGAVDEGTLGPVMGPLQAKEQSKASNGGKAKYRISRKK